jgi:acetylornithine/succinyldiaminopimelate/putrescine aminotransferase
MGLAEPDVDASIKEPSAKDAYRGYARPRTAEMLAAVGLDVEYTRAEGDFLYYRRDADGTEVEVLDLLGGFGATLFGHNHPELTATLIDHLRSRGPVHAQASVRSRAGQLAERLSRMVGASTGRSYVVTFSNSGAEAVESALKHAEMELWAKRAAHLARLRANIARVLQEAQDGTLAFAPSQYVVRSELDGPTLAAHFEAVFTETELALTAVPVHLALEKAFHGKTMGALQLTHNPAYRAAWQRRDTTLFVPCEDREALSRIVAAETVEVDDVDFDELGKVVLGKRRFTRIASCFAEPIQGEGGVNVVSPWFLEALRRTADDSGFALVFDEIQSGMGRTGTFLASEGVRADYYVLSKALGGGLVKIGAMMVDASRYQHDFGYLHTSTFAEDDASCAVALEALDLLERSGGRLMRECRAKGTHLSDRLESLRRDFPGVIRDVRGRGLLLGLRLASQRESSSPLLRVLSEQHLLGFVVAGYLLHEANIRIAPALSSHEVLRIEPSAYIAFEELERFVDALRKVCVLLRDGDAPALCRHMLSGDRR